MAKTKAVDGQLNGEGDAQPEVKEKAPRAPMTDEQRANISKGIRDWYAAGNKHPMTGKTFSDEAKAHMKAGQARVNAEKKAAKEAAAAEAAPAEAPQS